MWRGRVRLANNARGVCVWNRARNASSLVTTFAVVHTLGEALDEGLERVGARALELGVRHRLAVLVDQEGRHGADARSAGDHVEIIDVDLDESHRRVLGAELLEEWRDPLARPAPRRGEVHDDLKASRSSGFERKISAGGCVRVLALSRRGG